MSLRPDGRVEPGSSRFRIDLAPVLTDPNTPLGLQFRPIASAPDKKGPGSRSNGKTTRLDMSHGVARLVFTSQILIVCILIIMVVCLSYTAYRVNSSASYYYAIATPYLEEAKMHGMSIVRNADDASRSLHSVMDDVGALSSSSVPAMAGTLNRTAEAMARLTSLMAHPTLKVSME